MILDDAVGCELGCHAVPVPSGNRPTEGSDPRLHACVWRSLSRRISIAQLGIGRVEVVGIERDLRNALAMVVHFDDAEPLTLTWADIGAGALGEKADQRESLAARGDDFVPGSM